MKFLFFLIFTLLICSLVAMSKNRSSYDEVMCVIDGYSKKLKKEGIINRWYGLDYAGPDKVYDGKIHQISLGYSIDKALKYREARSFFYKIMDDLLHEINSREYLRDCFFHYPISYEDLHFAVGFDWENKGYLKKDDVDMISIEGSKIFYSIINYDGAIDKLTFHETYPGMGNVTRNEGATRTILRALPETEEEAQSSEAPSRAKKNRSIPK